MRRYTVITSTPWGYGKAFIDADSDSQALWKARVADALGKSEVVCVIPGEVQPIVPKSRRSAMAATASENAATRSDAMENQNDERCARLDASDCSRMDSSCSRMASDCDSMVRSSCMNAGSSSSVAGVRSTSASGTPISMSEIRSWDQSPKNGRNALRSFAMAASIVSIALSVAAVVLSTASILRF